MLAWRFIRIRSVEKLPAKLASFHRSGRLLPRVSRGFILHPAVAAKRSFTTGAILRGAGQPRQSRYFRPLVAERQWPNLLHFERTAAIPEAYVIRAPRVETQNPQLASSENNYVLYDPSSYRFSGFKHEPVPSTGVFPMKFYYQVVTTPTADTPGTTVLLHFPDKRYFFGQLSEGTQRACTERGVRLTYLTDVFLTGRTEWANNGGLIGTILTQADGLASSAAALEEASLQHRVHRGGQTADPGDKKHGEAYALHDGQMVAQRGTLTIHGGKNLSHSMATARRFVFRKGMPVYMREYDSETLANRPPPMTEDPCEEPTWFDNNIKVWAMPIKPSSSSSPPPPQEGTGQQSPRKRSLDEFQEKDVGTNPPDRRTREQVMTQSVVSDMFNSTWRMDALVETPLAKVNMPAAIFVRDPETKKIERYNGPAPGSGDPLPDITVLVRQPWPGATVEKLPPTNWCDEALSYVVRNHDIRGKFDVQKAQQLNVHKGPDFARLTKGESVVSLDGQTVTPDMVLGPPRPGKGLAIIELPTPEYVEGLINRPEWKSSAVTTGLEAFLWILGPGVGDHPGLREFVAKMSQCKHLVSSTDYCPNYLALASVAGSSIRLARLKGDSYSIPVHDNVTLPQPGTPTHGSENAKQMIQSSPFEPAEPGLVIDMEPNFNLNRAEVMGRLNPAETVQKIPRAVEQRMEVTQKHVAKPEFQHRLEEFRKTLPGQDTEIIALGTGSSSPSKYRNVSATLVKVPGYGYYMLDCGESTLGQMKRVFEPEQLREVLRNLRMIWISHLHADHHLGTTSLIKAWYRENYPEGSPALGQHVEHNMKSILEEKRLFVVSEQMMVEWLEEYAQVEDYGFEKIVPLAANPYMDKSNQDCPIQTSFSFRHCRGNGTYYHHASDVSKPAVTHLKFTDPLWPLSAELRAATGLADLKATRVSHCRGAMAVSLTFLNGFKISYSGDCRPSQSFAEIGRDSTVLLHEATFQDNMQDSAVAKKHSTTAEALEVGRRMRARTILLTHFSQRYQKVAHVDQRTGKIQDTEQPGPIPEQQQDQDQGTNPAEEPERLQETSTSFKDEIRIRKPSPRSRPSLTFNRTPVAVVFDYMRLRVGDIPLAEAYAPAIEKLFDILERATAEEAAEARKEKQLEYLSQRGRKTEKKEKKAAGIAEAKRTRSQQGEAGGAGGAEEKGHSVWSASESESGWSTSDGEAGSDGEGKK